MHPVTLILLIWEEVPEAIKTYCFDADEAMMKWLPLCHRNYINGECSKKAQAALDKLSEFLETVEPVDDKKPFAIETRTVVISGFIL